MAVKKKKVLPPLMSTPSPANTGKTWLLALDENGLVWIYLGQDIGWKTLDMSRMTPRCAALDNQAWRNRGRVPLSARDDDMWPVGG